MKHKQHVYRRFLPYLLHYRSSIILAMCSGILAGSSTVYLTYLIGQMIDQIQQQRNVDFPQLKMKLFLFVCILIVNVLCQWFIQRLGNRVAYKTANDLRQQAFTHLNTLPLRYFDQTAHGTISSRFTNDLDNVATAVTALFTQLFSGMTTIIVALIVMLRLNLALTLIVLAITPLILLVNWLVAQRARATFLAQQESIAELNGFLSEMIQHQKEVLAFNRQTHNQEKFEAINQTLYTRGQKAQFVSSLTNPSARFVDHLAYVAIGIVSAWLIFQQTPAMTLGVMASFTIYATQFTKPFIELSGITTQIQTARAGLIRTFALLDEASECDVSNVPLATVQGQITFANVSFSYEPTQPLIQDFSLQVNPGETIAIVGKTGAGKSTIINLLMRFYDVNEGKILLDGENIQTFNRTAYRQQFGMVLQETWLFDGTLRENLTFGNQQATDEEIFNALEQTALLNFVMRLPEKLDTLIGQQGLALSDGQKQLLTIARTMISQPKMLILDEATSSVDTLTEQHIQRAFATLMHGKTSFIIAHRLATIQSADKILVMDQGQIVEQGTHAALLAQKGAYAAIYEAQFQQ